MSLRREGAKAIFLSVDYLCAILGVEYEAIDIIEDIYVVKLKNSDAAIFINSNYNIIGAKKDSSNLEVAIRECKKKYEEERISGYLGGLSYQELSDISSRVDLMRYEDLRVNNLFYSVSKDNFYVKTLILIKFVIAEINIYYKHALPIMIAGGNVTDVYFFINNIMSKVWELVNSDPNITPLEILRALGQKNELGILEKYLAYIIPLFKEGYKKEMAYNLINILDMPHDLENVVKYIDTRIDRRPYASFSDLEEYIESNSRKK